MKTIFYKTGELNGSTFVKIFSRSKATLIIKNTDKYCFLWLIFVYLHLCENNHP